jgi:chorismate mutase/prephenate dehydratase
MDLSEIRENLDRIDRQMTELYRERLKNCEAVAEYKKRTGKAVLDRAREESKLKTLGDLTETPFEREAVEELYRQIMTVSRRRQYMLISGNTAENAGFRPADLLPAAHRVVYQGTRGAYSQMASEAFFRQTELFDAGTKKGAPKFAHVERFADAVREAETGRADYCVIPLENSSAGAVADSYELLTGHDVTIVGEYFLPVRHALLVLPGAQLADIRTVYSHPQGFLQCTAFFRKHRDMKQVSLENTAVAAKKVRDDGDLTQAAVASERAGELYGLTALRKGISGNRENTTRFVVLSRNKIYRRDAGKLSIMFELPHKAGSLYDLLGNMIFNRLNMVKIESRPIPGKNWEYRFFVDLEGNLSDPAVKNALAGIESEAASMRILGNY